MDLPRMSIFKTTDLILIPGSPTLINQIAWMMELKTQ